MSRVRSDVLAEFDYSELYAPIDLGIGHCRLSVAEPAALGLSAGYGAAPVLQNISFEVKPGEMVALIGANGAGKSTMMRAVAGLLRPVEGDVILDDVKIEAMAAHRIAARGLALVPEGRQVFPEMTVRDNLELGANTRENVDYAAEIEALLKRFPRLRDRITSRAGLLSGGEQQMLAIARGMMAKPRILSVDFPEEDVRNILRNVADLFELNIIIPEALQGKASIKLRDVSWRQIFQSVLTPINNTYV
eukprot:gene39341-biopygen26271